MRLTLRKVVQLVPISLLALLLGLEAGSKQARAAYGPYDALGTVGISAGVGAILGLSTTSFYTNPTDHMRNVAVGVGVGVIVGVGVAAYMLAAGDQEDEIAPEELLIYPEKDKKDGKGEDEPGKKPGMEPEKPEKKKKEEGAMLRSRSRFFGRRGGSFDRSSASVPGTTSQWPLLSGMVPDTRGWTVAMNVLELRF
ncbi:MAG: hypothetical protein HYW49_00980 [Deltaproteobacteria bacterium]|nr:hypothetical protein [Deltaproteobacteria bacterium]